MGSPFRIAMGVVILVIVLTGPLYLECYNPEVVIEERK
jgi:hypothetical protein